MANYTTREQKKLGYQAYWDSPPNQRQKPSTPCFKTDKEVYDWEAGWYMARREDFGFKH